MGMFDSEAKEDVVYNTIDSRVTGLQPLTRQEEQDP